MQWIEPHIQKAIDLCDQDWCVTLQSCADPAHYVQFTFEHINMAYPRTGDPKQIVDSLPTVEYVDVNSYGPDGYLTMNHGAVDVPGIAKFVAEYMERVLNSAEESNWLVSEEAL